MRIKTGDTVVVISGNNKDTQGKVLKVFPKENRVIVENVNMLTKHEKPQGPAKPGGIVKVEGPINASKVMYFCNKCNKATRVGYKVLDDGSKVRVCKKCGVELDK